ncbi:hypothetical protein GCM10009576_098820 [Streptomyces rhizosphaericus]|uniref:NlpC/P60 domain-containing protein n=1 Tax=Streptomyces rhizosphaericus TaxID=114699 RepID=A0ABN1SWA2_9ACTN
MPVLAASHTMPSPGGSVSHVAIYAGDGMVWEAASTGTSVRYAPVWDVARSYGRF